MSGRKRRGLGQGLGALIPGGGEGEASRTEGQSDSAEPPVTSGLREVPIDSILKNPYQPRTVMEEKQLEDLTNSIREHGIIQPLIVTQIEDGAVGERFRLIAGERRWRAARQAGLLHVPVVVKEASEREMLELALIENIQRADLNPMEEALAYQQMAEFSKLTREEIADRVGKNRSTVTNTMRLLNLPEPIQEMLRQGKLTEGHARPILRLPTATAMIEAAELIERQGMNVRQVEEWVGLYLEGSRETPAAQGESPRRARSNLSLQDHDLQKQFISALRTKVELRRRKKGGQLVIHFDNDEDLQSLYDLLIHE